MTSVPELLGSFASDEAARDDHRRIPETSCERARSMRILGEIASTLGIPVETFFAVDGGAETADAASAQDVAELTRAFLDVTDPDMRRHCLDVVRAAGAGRAGRAV